MKNSSGFTLALGALGFAVSTASTGNGLYRWVAATPSIDKASAIAVGFALSVLLSGVGFKLWFSVGRASISRKRLAVVTAMLALVVSSISVTFSAIGMVYFLKYEEIKFFYDRTAVERITYPLQEFASDLADMEAAMMLAASQSEAAATQEATRGGSCGQYSAPGQGPLNRLRKSQAKDAREMADLASGLRADANAIISVSTGAMNQNHLDQMFAQTRAIVSGSEFSRIKTYVKRASTDFSNAAFYWEGAFRSCKDPVLGASFEKLERQMQNIAVLPKIPPVISAVDFASVAQLLFQPVDKAADQTGFSTWIYVLVAVLIDLAGIIPAVLGGRIPPKLDDAQFRGLHDKRWVFQALTVYQNGKEYFMVPRTGAFPEVTHRAVNVATVLELERAVDEGSVPLEFVTGRREDTRDLLSAVSGGASTFDIYHVNDRFRDERTQIEHLLGFASGSAPYDKAPNSKKDTKLIVVS